MDATKEGARQAREVVLRVHATQEMRAGQLAVLIDFLRAVEARLPHRATVERDRERQAARRRLRKEADNGD